jgi:hypothetical protein
MNPYNTLTEAIMQRVKDMLERWKPKYIDESVVLGWTNLPPGSYTPTPDGGGVIVIPPHEHEGDGGGEPYVLTAAAIYALLEAEGAITLALEDGKVVIGATDTGGGTVPPPFVYIVDSDGTYLLDSDGAYLYEGL